MKIIYKNCENEKIVEKEIVGYVVFNKRDNGVKAVFMPIDDICWHSIDCSQIIRIE